MLSLKTSAKDNVLLLASAGIFFLLPWYYYYSGHLQPVDIMIALTVLSYVMARQFSFFMPIKIYSVMLTLIAYIALRFAFSAWHNSEAEQQFFANIYYMVLLALFVNILFYLYQTRTPQAFYQLLLYYLVVTVTIPLLILVIFGSDFRLAELKLAEPTVCRPVLSFYNANQLGFFALVNLSFFFYLTFFAQAHQLQIKKLLSFVIMNVNLLFLLLSVSRAASPAIVLYLLSYPLVFRFAVMKKHPLLCWSAIGVLTVVWLGSISVYHHLVLPAQVATKAPPRIGFLQDLYLRSIQGINYNFSRFSLFLFGNGSLFNPWRTTHLEYHNNITSLFNQGGIVALLLYGYLMLKIGIELFKKSFYCLFPFLCYLFYANLHYAFRTRLNWLFFAVIIFFLAYDQQKAWRSRPVAAQQ